MRHITCVFSFIMLVSASHAGNGREDVPLDAYLKLGADPKFECVGKVLRDGGFVGSAVLIDSVHVLSAAHMFLDSEREPVTYVQGSDTIIVFQPKNIRLTTTKNLRVVFGEDTVLIDTFEMHPEYMSSERKRADLVMLTLHLPIRGVRSASIYTGTVQQGSTGLTVGFGPLGSASSNSRSLRGRCAGWNVIDSITVRILVCDMDHPTMPELSTLGSSTPHELEYISTGGDSGGGWFVPDASGYSLAGLVTSVSYDTRHVASHGAYGAQGSFTRIDAYQSWIITSTR